MDNRMTDAPIFIGGLGRSGKTWMRFILDSHPSIALSRRTNMWTHYYNRYGGLNKDENFERCLHALLRSKHVKFLNPEPDRIRREFKQGERSYARLFALFHQHYAEQQGKSRWGDQTELLEHCANQLFAAYPDAKMLQMVRDPRDRYAATWANSSKERGGVGGATARWLYSVWLAERNMRRYPNQYMIVRYESLVSQPEKTMTEVCTFLGEEFFPDMLLMKDVPRFKHFSEAGRSPISTNFIDSYRDMIPTREIAFIQMLAGRQMSTHGYHLQRLNFSPTDWLTFSFWEFPTNLLHAFAWRTLGVGQYGSSK